MGVIKEEDSALSTVKATKQAPALTKPEKKMYITDPAKVEEAKKKMADEPAKREAAAKGIPFHQTMKRNR